MEPSSPEEIESSTEKLLKDLKAVVHDGEELLRAGVQDISDHGVAARERLAAALQAAKDTRERLEQRAAAALKSTDRTIREYPYQSIGVAFGIGILLGVLANRK
jgi:ElaB/YqjD/DUF883 family membrane-anchored ribosome-binding protein